MDIWLMLDEPSKCTQFQMGTVVVKLNREYSSVQLFVVEFIEKIFYPLDYNTKRRTMILGINSSLFEKPKAKRRQQQLRQFQNQAVLSHSQTFSSIGLKTDRKSISRVTFDFDSINSLLTEKTDAQRIHGKLSKKRVGGKVIFQNSQQKQSIKNKKQLSYLNLRLSELTSIQSKEELEGSARNKFLNIKSYRSSQQKEEDKGECSWKHQKYQSNLEELNLMSDQKIILNDTIDQNTKQKQQQKQKNTFKKGGSKSKLYMNSSNIHRGEKINSKSQIQLPQCQLLLQGSQKSKHKRPYTLLKSKGKKKSYLSSKSQSPNSSFLNQKPTKQKNYSTNEQIKFFLKYRQMKKIKEESVKILRAQDKKQKQFRHTSKQKFSEKLYFANSINTLDNSPKLMKYKTHLKQNSKKTAKKDYAKQNQQLQQILSECDNYKNEKTPIENQVTALKYCCQKIASNIQKTKHGLKDTHQF